MLSVKPISQHLRFIDFACDVKKLYQIKKNNIQMATPKVSINTSYRNIEDNLYEVVVGVAIPNDKDENACFAITCEYSGIFDITGHKSDESLKMIVGGYCAGFIFPFLRTKVATITLEAGINGVLLEPVDFYKLQKDYGVPPEENKEL